MDKPKLAWYENNKDFTDPINVYLKNDFEVQVFGVPDEAEAGIIQFQPEMIIFDYRMPFISGIDMYQKLKEKKLQFIPVFLTIWADDEITRQKIETVGVADNAIINKHMDCESLAQRIVSHYKRSKQ